MLTTSRPTGRWSSTAARVILAAIWAWAGIAKMTDPNAALRAVRAYRALPELLVRPVAWGLPFVEVALAVLLLTGIANRAASIIGAALLVIFMIAIAQHGPATCRSVAAASVAEAQPMPTRPATPRNSAATSYSSPSTPGSSGGPPAV